MSDESVTLTDSVARLPQRIAGLLDLLTTLDTRIVSALDSLEAMRRSVARFDALGDSGGRLVADIEERVAALDQRLNRDMDEVRDAILAKLGELDVAGFGPRLERMEAAILNIERATVNLDRAFEGSLELLPDFMTRKLNQEGRKKVDPPMREVQE